MAKNCKLIETAMFEAVAYIKPGMTEDHEDAYDLCIRIWPTDEGNDTTAEFTITSRADHEKMQEILSKLDADSVSDLVCGDELLKQIVMG